MKRLALTALLLTPTLAMASGASEPSNSGTSYLPNGQFTYEVFEASVEHADLEGCPAEFDAEVVFCRLSLSNDLAHIFVFAYAGDSPLMAVKSYELSDGFLPF